ncbi:VanW family protein [Metallumcola ferriviriculae]|uniref:VanW family protein n=1 Tax=Metallumcola ferriviriculae TaxID=3039180 RepID=A0AAU0UQ31_9FIRM|nr:VanW family protein [Desulfitibacteraceae bacterium MK1]
MSKNWKILMGVMLMLLLAGIGGCLAQRVIYGVKPGVTVEGLNVGGYLPPEVTRLVTHLAIEKNRPPKNAVMMDNGEIVKEVQGVEVDIEQSKRKIMSAKRREQITLVVRQVQPEITVDLIKRLDETLGTYTTFVSGTTNRLTNITLAAKKLNFTIVPAQSLFSFNASIGPRTVEKGYKAAPIIIGEGHGMDAGGGVCQVSSTLYNATMAAKLKIVERHPHSKKVYYVPVGRDAAISFPGLDFKFYNKFQEPVIIRSRIEGRVLTIWISGTSELKKQIQGSE